MLWKRGLCCTQYASKFGKLSSGHRTGKGQFSFQSQRRAMPKNAQTTAQLHSSYMLAVTSLSQGFPRSLVSKEFACNAGDLSSIPGLGRSPGKGNGNPLQYSCLENPTDGRTSWGAVYGVAQSRTWLKWRSSSSSSSSSRTENFQMYKLDLEKAEEPEIKLPTSVGSSKK